MTKPNKYVSQKTYTHYLHQPRETNVVEVHKILKRNWPNMNEFHLYLLVGMVLDC